MSSYRCAEPLDIDSEVSPQIMRILTAGVGVAGEGKSVLIRVGRISTIGLELQCVPAISLCPAFSSSVILNTIKWPPLVPAKSSG